RASSAAALVTPALTLLSLHDALPISSEPRTERSGVSGGWGGRSPRCGPRVEASATRGPQRGHSHPSSVFGNRAPGGGFRNPGATDRKSTRLNSSHVKISYAVFCLKKK